MRRNRKLHVFFAILACSLILSGCSSQASSQDFASIIKEESTNFPNPADELKCEVMMTMATFSGWTTYTQDCHRKLVLMVYSAERIISKFGSKSAPPESANLVSSTLRELQPIADSGFIEACAIEIFDTDACRAALRVVSVEELWKKFDEWQPYF